MPRTIESLQKLGKESYFAYVEKAVPAKAEAKASARTVGKLTLKTGEGTDDLVLVIARTTDSARPRVAEGAPADPAQRHHGLGARRPRSASCSRSTPG